MMLIDTKEETRDKLFENLKTIKWTQVILCVIGFFLSRMVLFDTFYTLGVCYIGAVFFNKGLRKWVGILSLAGVISLGILDVYTLKYVFIIILMMLLRGYMYMSGIRYTLRNQVAVTGTSIFCISILLAAINHFKWLDILTGLLETAISIGLVILLYYATEIIAKNRTNPLTQKETISMAFLAACVLGGIIDFYIRIPVFGSIYFKDVMTFVMIIAITYLGGTNVGVSMAIVISSLLVVIGYMPPHFTAIYTFAVLIGTLFFVLERTGIIFAMGVGLLLGFALFNDRIIDREIFGAYLAASMITFILPKNYFGISGWFNYGSNEEDEKHLVRVQKIITEKLHHFSKAFDHLSRTFEKIADKKITLDERDINYIIEDTGEKMCQNCSMKTFCWHDYIDKTYKSAYKMLDLIEQKGQLKVGDMPEDFKKSCIHAESFACTLGFKLDLFKQNLMWKNRFVESRSLVGQQFKAVAKSISKLREDIEKEFYFNEEDEAYIKEILHTKGIKAKDIMVLENNGRKQEIHVYTHYYKNDMEIKDHIVDAIYRAIGVRSEIERLECNEEERYLYFKFRIMKAYGIVAGAAFHAKGEISGDVYSCMEVEKGKYLLALADGMGSGQMALEESTATIELLESFMDSGFENDLAIKIINSVLVLKSDIENFSTMDITLIDEYTGVAEFLKLGAATSFILRNQEVITIQATTLPVGILHDVDVAICKKQLKDGDVIIMVTDGMLQGENDLLGKEDTFKHFILEANTNNPAYMAEYLMKKSRDLLGNGDKDDMTIIVARIWQKETGAK